jgi:hypothetical protein
MDWQSTIRRSTDVSVHSAFHDRTSNEGSLQGTSIEKYALNELSKCISIPWTKVIKLVSPKDEPLGMQGRQGMINSGKPLRHSVVVGIFSLEGELLPELSNARHNIGSV